MELAEKLETTFATYLKAQFEAALQSGTLPGYFDPANQIHAGQTDQTVSQQVIRCVCDDSAEEMPQFTGNFWFPFRVELLTPVAEQTDGEMVDANPANATSQLDRHRTVSGLLSDAMIVDTLPAVLNTTAASLGAAYGLTVFGVLDRMPQRQQTDNHYLSGISFRIYAASSVL